MLPQPFGRSAAQVSKPYRSLLGFGCACNPSTQSHHERVQHAVHEVRTGREQAKRTEAHGRHDLDGGVGAVESEVEVRRAAEERHARGGYAHHLERADRR